MNSLKLISFTVFVILLITSLTPGSDGTLHHYAYKAAKFGVLGAGKALIMTKPFLLSKHGFPFSKRLKKKKKLKRRPQPDYYPTPVYYPPPVCYPPKDYEQPYTKSYEPPQPQYYGPPEPPAKQYYAPPPPQKPVYSPPPQPSPYDSPPYEDYDSN